MNILSVLFQQSLLCRVLQERKRIQVVSSGMHEEAGEGKDETTAVSAVQILPPLLQMYPDVEVEFADEICWKDVRKRIESGNHTWLVAGRTIYLISPSRGGTIMHCSGNHIAPLLQMYLHEKNVGVG
jgi:hypothetical protein